MNTGRAYLKFLGLKREYTGLKEQSDKNRADLEYYQFQFNQLEEVKLKSGEQAELEAEQELLEHAGEIKERIKRLFQSAV